MCIRDSGYNQAELIARRLGRRCGIPVVQPLIRLKNTANQTHLTSRKARIDNLRDAFALDRPGVVKGRRVALVDDVLTTGATARSAGRLLLPEKPKSVSLIVLAVADPKGHGFERI
jgi:predicted amidophosphoribosyltransferase